MPKFATPKCLVCHRNSVIELTNDEWGKVIDNALFIQDALPDRSPDFRELVQSGTHNGCWMTMFHYGENALNEFRTLMTNWINMMYWNPEIYNEYDIEIPELEGY